MKFRIWHTPNPPRIGFRVAVDNVEEAKKLLKILADYDMYLGDLIDSNASGLEYFDEKRNEWSEWYSEEGDCIWDIDE